MKKHLLTALAFILLLIALISCTEAGETQQSDPPQSNTSESEKSDMIPFDPSEYVIIYPSNGFKEKYLALITSHAIAKETEHAVPYRSDAEHQNQECEILIGCTDRPESLEALNILGDADLLITVINKKIVIIATDDSLYDAAVYRFSRVIENGSVPADLRILLNTAVLEKVCDGLKKNSTLSLSAALSHKSSTVEIRFGEKYTLEFAADHLALYNAEGKRAELAKKVLLSETNHPYTLSCSFDGEYLRAYRIDPAEYTTPFAVFEIKAPDLSGEVRVGEVSGYGAEIADLKTDALAPTAGGKTYQNNVIMNAADPDILYHEGYYYVYVTGDGYPVYRSTDLADWEYVGKSLPEVSWNIDKRYMWAPDVEYINGKFYMAVTMGEAGFGIAVSDQPEGPFVCTGETPFLTKTIDGHIFVDDDGRIYLYYTSWCDGRAYGIWGLEMEPDCLTPKWETEKLIFTPTDPWEKTMNRGGVVEAPYMLKKEGIYYLVYSGSHFEADYAVGYATSANPLEGFKKSEHNPILRGTADTRGTGHCSIVTTRAGGMVMIYHTHNSPTAVQPRHVAIDPVRFVKTADGYRLEVCGPTTSKVLLDVFN